MAVMFPMQSQHWVSCTWGSLEPCVPSACRNLGAHSLGWSFFAFIWCRVQGKPTVVKLRWGRRTSVLPVRRPRSSLVEAVTRQTVAGRDKGSWGGGPLACGWLGRGSGTSSSPRWSWLSAEDMGHVFGNSEGTEWSGWGEIGGGNVVRGCRRGERAVPPKAKHSDHLTQHFRSRRPPRRKDAAVHVRRNTCAGVLPAA